MEYLNQILKKNKNMRKPIYWFLILAAVALLLYYIAAQFFPYLIGKFTAFLVGLFVAITGLVFRKKRA